MIPLAVPDLDGNEAKYLAECVESTYVSSVGPFVDRFEAMIAEAAGVARGLAVTSGTSGLHLALHGAGVGPGDLVILPAMTFVASANAIAHCGASPWLFDIDELSWTLDPAQFEHRLSNQVTVGMGGAVHRSTGRRIAAVVPVHTLGHPADIDTICDIASSFRIPVIADAAAAMGARYRGRPIGEGPLASVYSFNGNKTVTAGGGGGIVSDDIEFLDRLRHLATTARVDTSYLHDEVGFNYRMTNLQAAVGCAQMERYPSFLTAKRYWQAAYARVAADHGLEPFPEASWATSSCWFSGLLLRGWSPHGVEELRFRLRNRGVDARPFWRPMHEQPPFRDSLRESMSVTDLVWPRVLTLPCSSGMSVEDLERVLEILDKELAR